MSSEVSDDCRGGSPGGLTRNGNDGEGRKEKRIEDDE